MPGLDRTGPMGMGSKTGWGRGLCGGNANAAGGGFGFGRGRGRGRGRRWAQGGGWYGPDPQVPAAADNQQQMDWIQSQIQVLTQALEDLKNQIQTPPEKTE